MALAAKHQTSDLSCSLEGSFRIPGTVFPASKTWSAVQLVEIRQTIEAQGSQIQDGIDQVNMSSRSTVLHASKLQPSFLTRHPTIATHTNPSRHLCMPAVPANHLSLHTIPQGTYLQAPHPHLQCMLLPTHLNLCPALQGTSTNTRATPFKVPALVPCLT